MKAEISNLGLHRERRFTGVYLQQGRMLVDRDWNELCEILRDLGTAVASEAIGTGVPRHGGLLYGGQPSPFPPRELLIRNEGGLVAAAGVIGEVLPRDSRTSPPIAIYQNQLDLPATVRVPLTPGQRAPDWSVAGQIPEGATQPLLRTTQDPQLLYVDIWDRIVTVFETGEGIADDLIDPALHGADTCFRKQRLVQIKAATAGDLVEDGDPCLPAFLPERIPPKGNGTFAVQLTGAGQGPDPCDPCAEQVTMTRSVTNHLFRLEVHSVEFDKQTREPKQLILKWSRDNGARELRPGEFAQMSDTAHSYEYFSDATERLLGMPSDDWVAEECLRGVLDPADPLQVTGPVSGVLPRIREWDGWCRLEGGSGNWRAADGRDAGKTLGGAAVMDKGTLTVQPAGAGYSFSLALDGKTFLAGDYWLALVRTRAPEDKRVRVVSPTPIGVEHRYCILGTLGSGWGELAVPVITELSSHDLRRLQHPALTCLDASDVGYATFCQSGLFDAGHDTVKKALDQICHIRAGHVGYSQQCNTSVYSQSNAANVTTVADALDLLCNVSAEQILFSNPGCSYLANATPPPANVKAALDALCIQPADTIPFRPVCGYLHGQLNVPANRNVAAALEALCTQPANTIPFEPVCGYLKEQLNDPAERNVAAALEALCKRPDHRPYPFIAAVNWKEQHDADMTFKQLTEGLTVVFSKRMTAQFLGPDVFIVTCEFSQNAPAGTQASSTFLSSLIMLGSFDPQLTDDGSQVIGHAALNRVTFRPSRGTTDVILAILNTIGPTVRHGIENRRIRVRVRLIGRAIFDWETGRPLDGHVPMKPRIIGDRVPEGTLPARIELDFDNPGIGQPSDFESWFYLVPTPIGPPPPPPPDEK